MVEEQNPIEPVKDLSFKEKFRLKWNKTDQLCPTCGHVQVQERGLTRQNIKRLFSFKMTISDAITLFMIIMVLVLAYAYNTETQQCREFLETYGTNLSSMIIPSTTNSPGMNVPKLDINYSTLDLNNNSYCGLKNDC